MIQRKVCFLLFICLALAITCSSQKVIVKVFMENRKASTGSDTIYYDFNRKLSWSDFKGKPREDYFAGAVTASGFAFDSQINFDGANIYLNIGVYTFFTKSDSWRKPQINSDYHLMHEQHHFDITMMGSEKFISEIQKVHFTKNNYTALLTSIFDKVYKENSDEQHLYDRDTNHSINAEKQLEWNDKIAGEIQKLKQGVVMKN
jgi:hypothetical protein